MRTLLIEQLMIEVENIFKYLWDLSIEVFMAIIH